MVDVEQKRKRIETLVKCASVPIIGFLVAPFVMIAVKGALGLLAAALIGVVAVNLAPWVAFKAANWRLKLIKAEAAQNPIETLENQYNERLVGLGEAKNQLGNLYAQIENVKVKIDEHRRRYPGTQSVFEAQISNMIKLYDSRAEKFKRASRNLEKFGDIIEQKRSEWEVVKAFEATTKAANVGSDFMSKLKEDTAVNSVQINLSKAFGELQTSLLEEEISSPAEDETEKSGRIAIAVSERVGLQLPEAQLEMPKQRATQNAA